MSNGLTPDPDRKVEIKDLPTQDSPAESAFIAIQQGGETYKINLGSLPIANILPDATSTSKGVVSAGDGLSAQDGRLSVSGDFLEGTGNQAIEGSLVVTNANGYATRLDGYLLWMDGKRAMFAYHGPQSGDRHILHFNYEKDFDEVNFQGRVAFGQADVEVNGSLIYNGSEVLTRDSTVQKLAIDSVGTDQLQQSSVSSSAIADDAITGGKIAKASITSDNLRGNIPGSKLADGSLGGRKIIDASIDGSKIEQFAIGGDLLSTGGVGEGAIAAGAVTPSKIPDSSLETSKLTPEAFDDLTKVQDNSIKTESIQDGSVTFSKLAEPIGYDIAGEFFPDLYTRQNMISVWNEPVNDYLLFWTTKVNINGSVYRLDQGYQDSESEDHYQLVYIDKEENWDDSQFASASNRAGKDFYIYAVTEVEYNPIIQQDVTVGKILFSENSTLPGGYTKDNSRKIGGFHCLCVDVKDKVPDGHELKGLTAGYPLPASLWDLKHRSDCDTNEGMVYDHRSRKWVDIYLPSWDGDTMRSLYNAVIADGGSSPSFMWYNFVELFGQVGKQMTSQEEFMCYSRGSNQQTDIQGDDPVRTGGHVDSNGRRMISDIGVEDCCGALWQWAREAAADTDQGSNWVQQSAGSYDSQQNIARGQGYEVPNRPLLGGLWNRGTRCGSRCSGWYISPLYLGSDGSSRGVAEPRRTP